MKSTRKRPTNSPDTETQLTRPRLPRLVTPGIVALFVLFGGLVSARAAPTITTLSTTSGPVNTSVTITGTNFGTGGTVKFHGTAAAPSIWSATRIVVSVPAAATTGPVVVNVGGINSNGVTFTVTPHINGLSLTKGPAQMGFVINGTTFGSSQGMSTAKIGATSLSVISWSTSSITAGARGRSDKQRYCNRG